MSYRDDAPTCSALDARANVEEACNDKQSCLLTADENTYGKSLCPHVNKFLQLKYACVPLDDDVMSKDTGPKHDGVEFSPQLNEEEEAVSRTLQELGEWFLRTFILSFCKSNSHSFRNLLPIHSSRDA